MVTSGDSASSPRVPAATSRLPGTEEVPSAETDSLPFAGLVTCTRLPLKAETLPEYSSPDTVMPLLRATDTVLLFPLVRIPAMTGAPEEAASTAITSPSPLRVTEILSPMEKSRRLSSPSSATDSWAPSTVMVSGAAVLGLAFSYHPVSTVPAAVSRSLTQSASMLPAAL